MRSKKQEVRSKKKEKGLKAFCLQFEIPRSSVKALNLQSVEGVSRG